MKGHIRKRGANSWELKFDAGRDDAGRRKIRFVTVKGSKREAQAELARRLASVADGGHVDPSKLTVIDHVRNRVALWRANGTISARTAQGYDGLIANQIAPFPIASRPLQKLSSSDVEIWHSKLRTEGRRNGKGGVSTRTIHHAHKLLAKSLREAVRHGLVLRNVATEQRPPKLSAAPMVILTREQVKELPAKLHDLPIRAPAIVALLTGIRRGELLALHWPDVDLDRKVIRIRDALEQTLEHGVRFKGPKTKSGVRTVSLPDDAVAALQEHRRQQLEMRVALGLGKAPENALVFPAPGTDRLWIPDSFSSAWGDVGVGVTFHALRHTHASMLIAAGIPITEIAYRLGHASPATTLSIYAHMFERTDAKAAAAINAALGG
jgi:integrase